MTQQLTYELLKSYINQDLIHPSKIHFEHKNRTIRSKYDIISVHVKIDVYEYVFSRFNLSRYLMACHIPEDIAVDISKQVKQDVVDNTPNCEITQEELTEKVFQLVEKKCSDSLFKHRFKLIYHINLERVPIIILISGTGFLGKPSLAFLLGERLNVSTILQTSIVNALTNGTNDHINSSFWVTKYKNKEEFFTEFERDCETSDNGIAGDIHKTLTDGKPLIVEGIHLNPKIYLKSFGGNSLISLDKFNIPDMGKVAKGKMGIILPILVTKTDDEIRETIKSEIFSSHRFRSEDFDSYYENAINLQDYLKQQFPEEYTVPLTNYSSAIDRIHELFLQKLDEIYGKDIVDN